MSKKTKSSIKPEEKSIKNALLEQYELFLNSVDAEPLDDYKHTIRTLQYRCFPVYPKRGEHEHSNVHFKVFSEIESNNLSFEFVYRLLYAFYDRASYLISYEYSEFDYDMYLDILNLVLLYIEKLSSDKDKITLASLVLNQTIPKNNERVRTIILKIALVSNIWDVNLDNLRQIKFDNSDSGMVNRWYYYNLLRELKQNGISDYITSYLDDIFNGEEDSYCFRTLITYSLQFVTQSFSVREIRALSKIYTYLECGKYECIYNQTVYDLFNIKRKVYSKNLSTLETLNYTPLLENKTLVASEFSFTEGHIITGSPIFTKDYDSLGVFSGIIPKINSLDVRRIENQPIILSDGKDYICVGREIKVDNPLFLPRSMHSYLSYFSQYKVPRMGSVFVPSYMNCSYV